MAGAAFDPEAVRCFRFLAFDFDADRLTARFDYGFDDDRRFREELIFHGAAPPAGAAAEAALERALRYLHLAAGVSYFKAAAPSEISVETGPLSAVAAAFFGRLYRRGLAEFAWRNRLERIHRVRFPGAGRAAPVEAVELRRRTAVPVGGGKDSIVTLEALARSPGEAPLLVSVGDYEPIRRTAEIAGRALVVVERRICPRLLELNRRGAYNGHVPVSAVIAFILAAAAALYGFDAAALSNERSADAADLVWRGRPVNHEYSKGARFERDFDRLVTREVAPGFRYFSLLRPFSELTIAGLFSRHAAYRRAFRSCNAAYRLRVGDRAAAWCGDCPKCRFVFLALAPFLSRSELVEVFGHDLLDDPSQLPGYRALAGLESPRPLECVGEERESAAALLLAAVAPDWRRATVVRRLAEEVRRRSGEPRELVRQVLTPSVRHRVPERYRRPLEALARRARDDRDRLLETLERPVATR